MKKIKLIIFTILLSISTTVFAQQYSIGGFIGYSKPIIFGNSDGMYLGSERTIMTGTYAKNGIYFELEALFYPKFSKSKWGIGIMFSNNIFFFDDEAYTTSDNYKRYLYGVKTVYKFLSPSSKFQPYIGLSYGRGSLNYPQIFSKETSEEIQYAYKTTNSGSICPSLGLEYSNFIFDILYFHPISDGTYYFGSSSLVLKLGYRLTSAKK